MAFPVVNHPRTVRSAVSRLSSTATRSPRGCRAMVCSTATNGVPQEMKMSEPATLSQLANGDHERCHWCKASFWVQDGKMQRYKALDGYYYCDETHASAPYLKVVS